MINQKAVAVFRHGVELFCDRAVFVSLLVMLRYSRYDRKGRLIEIYLYAELYAVVLTVLDDLVLIGGTFRAQCSNAFFLGHLPGRLLDKGKVCACKGIITLSKFFS
jgi:hypothetical protein